MEYQETDVYGILLFTEYHETDVCGVLLFIEYQETDVLADGGHREEAIVDRERERGEGWREGRRGGRGRGREEIEPGLLHNSDEELGRYI